MADDHARSPETQSIQESDPRDPARRLARSIVDRFSPEAPESVGPYKVLKLLGEGGMGMVYLAEQTKPIHRRVALKVIKLGMDTRSIIARFEVERDALALMNHPNVAKVFDAGATEQGRPYFAMEYVEGEPITQFCDNRRLSIADRLELFMQVGQAVQHAHQKGIIHRDLKPSNVLVSEVDGKPSAKVIDFGIAKATQQKLTEVTMFTEAGQFVGTPAYMSPEQADPSCQDIDTRTDVYSLGVMLYELLVGALPFDPKTLRGAMFLEMQRIIREVDPPKPSTKLSALKTEAGAPATGSLEIIASSRGTHATTLIRQLRGDLDWIVMKCLEKDRARRYETANTLVLEIQRFLKSEPVLAGPPSATYRVGKFLRRNRLAVGAVAVVVIVLIAGLIGTSVMYVRADRERDKAQRVSGFMSDILAGAAPSVALGRDTTMLREMLDVAATRVRNGELSKIPDAEFQLRRTLGRTFLYVGNVPSSLEMIEPMVAMTKETFGAQSRELFITEKDLFMVHYEAGRYPQAEALCREGLVRAKAVFKNDDALMAGLLVDLGMVLNVQGNIHEPAQHLRDAIAIQRRLPGDQREALAYSNFQLGIVLENSADYPGAAQCFREATEKNAAVLGTQHPRSLECQQSLGRALTRSGQHDEAIRVLTDSLALHRKLFGERHFQLASVLYYLGRAYEGRTDYAKAEPYFNEALSMRISLLGNEHRDVAACLGDLAFVKHKLGQSDEAERLAREALVLFKKLVGDIHHDVATQLGTLAIILTKKGQWNEAEASLREALAIMGKTVGDDHSSTITPLFSLSNILILKEDYTGALDCLNTTMERTQKFFGTQHPMYAQCLIGLGIVSSCKGERERAEQYFRQSVTSLEKSLGAHHQIVVLTRANLAYELSLSEKFDEAELLARSCLADLSSSGLEADAPRIDAQAALAIVYLGRGQLNDAEEILLPLCENAKDRNDISTCGKREFLRQVVRLYELRDAAEPGKGYAEKAAEYRNHLANDTILRPSSSATGAAEATDASPGGTP